MSDGITEMMKGGRLLAKGDSSKKNNETEDSEELKPCPFCGESGIIHNESFPSWRKKYYYPSCTNSDCPAYVEEQDEQGGTNCSVSSKREAVDLWNQRATLEGK